MKKNFPVLVTLITLVTLFAGCKTGSEVDRKAGLTEIYPADPPVDHQKLGVAFSGGGTRSMTASMGQLRALRDLGLLNNDEIGLISSVSGGTWAAASYIYRKKKYMNDEFLGIGVSDPAELVWKGGRKSPENLAYISKDCMGIIPTQTYIKDLLICAIKLKKKYGYRWSDIWARTVGKSILEEFDLNPKNRKGRPNRYIGDRPEWVNNNVAGIPKKQFQLIYDETAPPLIINGALFSDLENRAYRLIPFEINGIKTGLSATVEEGGFTYGGGFANAYSFASTDPYGAGVNIVNASLQKTSLADAAGISSAFFATALANRLRALLKGEDWQSKLKADKVIPSFLIKWLEKQRESMLEELEKETTLIPIYPYWSVAGVQSGDAEDRNFYFADGGGLENTGVTTLVSKGYTRILSFYNSQGPLVMETSDGVETLSVKDNLAALFGYTPMVDLDNDGEKKYYHFSELSSNQFSRLSKTLKPFYDNQIFAEEDFEVLLEGLYQANADENGLGARAAVFKQTLTTVDNEKFHVQGGRSVEVTWFYLTPASDWNEQLNGEVRWKLDKHYSNFPNYDTIKDIGMEPRQINLLAHFTYWMVMNSGL